MAKSAVPVKETRHIGEGMVTDDDEGRKAKPVGPAIPDSAFQDDPHSEKDEALSVEETERLCGDLEPGETGWLPLDLEGNVTGPARRGNKPDSDSNQRYANVQRTPDLDVKSLQTVADHAANEPG